MTTSAASATSAAEPAAAAPAASVRARASGFGSKATTAQDPLAIKLRHMAPPMTPKPINPTRSIIAPVMEVVPLREMGSTIYFIVRGSASELGDYKAIW
jgi:hypothetical protein